MLSVTTRVYTGDYTEGFFFLSYAEDSKYPSHRYPTDIFFMCHIFHAARNYISLQLPHCCLPFSSLSPLLHPTALMDNGRQITAQRPKCVCSSVFVQLEYCQCIHACVSVKKNV